MHSLPATKNTPMIPKPCTDTETGRMQRAILTHAHHRTALLALLTTFLGLALVVVHDSDSGVLVGHLAGLMTQIYRNRGLDLTRIRERLKIRGHSHISKRIIAIQGFPDVYDMSSPHYFEERCMGHTCIAITGKHDTVYT